MSIVRTATERALWEQAQTKPEWGTTRLWEHKVHKEFPAGEDWIVASQQPPTDEDGNLRRVDLVVDKWKRENYTHRLFIFEAKKKSATLTEIDELEQQAYNACLAYLIYTDREHMYAMTVVGTMARLWIAHIGADIHYLVPWIPAGDGLSRKEQYIEANSTDGYLIEEGFKYMKKYKEMPNRKLDKLCEAVAPKESTSEAQLSNIHSNDPSRHSIPAEPSSSAAPYKITYSPHSSVSGLASTTTTLSGSCVLWCR